MTKKINLGFTIIEMLVVIGVLGVIMVAVTTILINSLKAKSKSEVSNRLEENGAKVVADLRWNVLNADGAEITCAGSSLTVKNKFDGKSSTIKCIDDGVTNEIASISAEQAEQINLTGVDVGVTNCPNFVSCDLSPTNEVTAVNFAVDMFSSLGSTAVDSYVYRTFNTKVVVRSY